ncbi:MAG TPA: hypothetical protein PLZ51_12645, partial [Aggregatilineales bacterium]|nr:hypothetical protein [Aggregatilineales bacterium]
MIKFRLILIIMVVIFATTTHAQTDDDYEVITPENVEQLTVIQEIGADETQIIFVDPKLCDPTLDNNIYFRLGNWINNDTFYFVTDDTIWQYTIGSNIKIPRVQMCEGSNL